MATVGRGPCTGSSAPDMRACLATGDRSGLLAPDWFRLRDDLDLDFDLDM